jgi:hypothetical protein
MMQRIPWFGARKMARALLIELQTVRENLNLERVQMDTILELNERLVAALEDQRAQNHTLVRHLNELGALSCVELEAIRLELEGHIDVQRRRFELENHKLNEALVAAQGELYDVRSRIVETEEAAILQEVGVYQCQHPLSDVVAYEEPLDRLQRSIKAMIKREGMAVLADSGWIVNGSLDEGRAMIRDYSKLMLRAFNAEADNLVRSLKPHKLGYSIERLQKVADTIERLGQTMKIRIGPQYLQLRIDELNLTADFLQKQAEQKEIERVERERLRDERKAQQEIEREKLRLEKERQHYANALNALTVNGDEEAATRVREQLADVEQNIESFDSRSANTRAGYVYVISNIGSFGEQMIKVGMTRRLDPLDRIRELSDASVPFNFDIHALFFSNDAVGIEAALHDKLAHLRVNMVNHRREFFRATPLEVKDLLKELSGELLEFHELPEALEYRQCISLAA